jgi:hypothetical protein
MQVLKRKPLKVEHEVLVQTVTRATNVMMLLQGTQVICGEKSGFLNFEKEVIGLTYVLQVLGSDASSPVFG